MVTRSVRHGAILLVDDEPDILASLKLVLEDQLKVSVFTATNAKAALVVIKEQPVHLIVSDLRMPGMNGNQFLREARRIYPGVHVMMMSGSPQEPDEHLGPLSGFFAKPVNAARIVAAIRDLLVTS